MKRTIGMIGLLLAFLVAGCATTGPRTPDPEYRALKKELKKRPNDMELYAKAIDFANNRLQSTGDSYYRDEAALLLERFLKRNPGHVSASILYYRLRGQQSLQYGSLNYIEKMRRVLEQAPQIASLPGFTPPSLIEWVVGGAQGWLTTEKYYDLLKQAIREAPDNARIKLLLASSYMKNKRYALAKSLILQVKAESPENPGLPGVESELAFELAEDAMCNPDREDYFEQLKEAIALNKKASRHSPDDVEPHYRLSLMYEALGRPRLAVFQAEQVARLDPDFGGFLAEQYRAALDLEKAAEQTQKVMESEGESSEIQESFAEISYLRGDWETALAHLENMRGLPRDMRLYRWLDELYLVRKLGYARKERRVMDRLGEDDLDEGSWRQVLWRHAVGHIDDEMLLRSAEDACQLVEAHAEVARNAELAGNIEKTRHHFQKVLDLKVYRYFEHLRALQWMKSHPVSSG